MFADHGILWQGALVPNTMNQHKILGVVLKIPVSVADSHNSETLPEQLACVYVDRSNSPTSGALCPRA